MVVFLEGPLFYEMALSATELRKGKFFEEEGSPFVVLEYSHTKMGRGTANVKVKVRNLKTGATLEKTFISSAYVEEAEIKRKEVQYLYSDGENSHFMEKETFEQFSLPSSVVGSQADFMREGMDVTVVYYGGKPLSVVLPLKVDLKVTETGPSEKGDTRSSATKEAVLETGCRIQVPMFINVGDLVKVNTEEGSYSERIT